MKAAILRATQEDFADHEDYECGYKISLQGMGKSLSAERTTGEDSRPVQRFPG